MRFSFPNIYPILDSSFIPAKGREDYLSALGASLAGAGVTLLEYRIKTGSDAEIVADADALRRSMPASQVKLILDDRADLIEGVRFDGVHLDAGDLAPAEARRMVGVDKIVGTFGGSETLLPEILRQPADYLAIGPVFETRTKHTENRPIGIGGVQRLRQQAGANAIL